MTLLLDLGADINAPSAAGDTAACRAIPAILQFRGGAIMSEEQERADPLEALRARDLNEQTIALLRQVTGDFTQVSESEHAADPSPPAAAVENSLLWPWCPALAGTV